MRYLIAVLVLTLIAVCAAQAAVTIDANNMAAKDAFDSIGKQTAAQVLVDADVTGNVTAVLKDVTTEQAMDTVTKALKVEWRKIQFVVGPNTTIDVAKVKAAATALAALDMPGLSVVDKTTGKSIVFAKAQADASAIKLPEGQSWKTFYLVSKPGTAKAETANASGNAAAPGAAPGVDPIASERLGKIAAMTPEDRQNYIRNEFAGEMQLAPDVRVQMWKDRLATLQSMMQDPTMRDQLRADMRAAGIGRGGGNRGNRNGGAPQN